MTVPTTEWLRVLVESQAGTVTSGGTTTWETVLMVRSFSLLEWFGNENMVI